MLFLSVLGSFRDLVGPDLLGLDLKVLRIVVISRLFHAVIWFEVYKRLRHELRFKVWIQPSQAVWSTVSKRVLLKLPVLDGMVLSQNHIHYFHRLLNLLVSVLIKTLGMIMAKISLNQGQHCHILVVIHVFVVRITCFIHRGVSLFRISRYNWLVEFMLGSWELLHIFFVICMP